MQLRYISVPALIAEAGGDPWAVNQSLRAGNPFRISQLANAFHTAGRCTAEADATFEQARSRFDAAWNHQNGDHPINDSAEVQRVTKLLGAQSLQLPKIAADLESIAAALAEAQKAAAARIAALDTQLQTLDNMIGQAVEMEKDPALTAADRQALDAFITGREDNAIGDTQAALHDLQSTRDTYANLLHQVQANGNLTPQDAVLTTELKPADLGEGQGFPANDPRSQVLLVSPNTNRTPTTYKTSSKMARVPPSAAIRETVCPAARHPSWRKACRAPGRCRRGPRWVLMVDGMRFSATPTAVSSQGSTSSRPTDRSGISPTPLIR
ncbi:hypothetical protein BZL30_7020 [Mycobacterium kansasii]|uniref:Predicted hydrolase N-terminal domain-containing protein n=1 Tax=Mycobacterium kansasii TaxID=1768 RepID=A0A1V3WP97_MYCKA|nr:hypothetical protein BZL30_7020 [Mycobacterium kansasii]